ncbi:MAG: NAD(P)-dependent oxidoreductase [Proteobacteria bacterium]|nr:NAD(P)-dependent oxidoreductase [Burkholderiales bacterium]
MGAALTTRLLGLGHEVTVWNRTPQKAQALAGAGAKVAATPRALAQACEVILSIVADAAAVDTTYFGPDGVGTGDLGSKLVIEMSTLRPETQRMLAERLKKLGAAVVECPVGGTIGPAREGKLLGFVGGSEADFALAKPILDQLCRRVEHIGPSGAGASMKLAINLPLLVYWQALGEALALVKPLGLDPKRVMDIIADTSGGPNMLKVRGSTIATALAGGDTGAVTFDVDLIRKDMATMIEEAASLGATLPVTERALQIFDEAAREGMGADDAVKLPVRWLRQS